VIARDGDRATMEAGAARLAGAVRESIAAGAAAAMAIRPDDLVAGNAGDNAIAAKVETIEYRGREFVGTARAGDLELVFRSDRKVDIGSTVHLSADPARALIFAAGG
jgi:putative spermidine/putrescine transport system ATP-binding protein